MELPQDGWSRTPMIHGLQHPEQKLVSASSKNTLAVFISRLCRKITVRPPEVFEGFSKGAFPKG